MILDWLAEDDGVEYALGEEYSYIVTDQPCRGCYQVEQTWWQPEFNNTLLLKRGWRASDNEAKEQAQAWEDAFERHRGADDRSRRRVAAVVRNRARIHAGSFDSVAKTQARQNNPRGRR